MAIERNTQRFRHYLRFQQGIKIAHCPLCGKPRDAFHRGSECAERYLKEQDASGTNPSLTRRKS